MDLHHFDGKNLSVWMFQLQQNFLYYNTPNDLHKYMMASYYMEGEALTWLETMERSGVFTMDADWEKFVRLINIRFGHHEIVHVHEVEKESEEQKGDAFDKLEEHHSLIPELDPVEGSIPEPVQVEDTDQKLQIPTLNPVPMKVDEVCDRKIQENKNVGSLEEIKVGEKEQRNGEAIYTQIQATNLVANTYHLFDESPQPHNSESLVEKQLPNWVACDNNEQHLFDERSDEVELVVRKHKWRWKQVVQEGDAEVEEEVAKAHIYGFVGQLNEGHYLKKQPIEFRVNQVLRPFDDYKFNFTKVGQEVLFRVGHAYIKKLIMRAFLLAATFLEGSGKLFEVMEFLLLMSVGDRLGCELAQELYLDISTKGIALCLIFVSEKTDMFDHAYKVFEEMPELNYERTTKSLNALLTACVMLKVGCTCFRGKCHFLGLTGFVVLKSRQLSDIIAQLQELLKGVTEAEVLPYEYETAILAAQVQLLAQEIRELVVSHLVTIFNRDSASQGSYTSFLLSATARGAMGYCYMGEKSWWLSDVTFVRMHNMANDVDSLEISHEILATRRPGVLSNDSKLMVAKLFDDYLAEMGMQHVIHVKIIRSVHAIWVFDPGGERNLQARGRRNGENKYMERNYMR